MAIKYARPIEARTRPAAAGLRVPSAPLDLAIRPRRNRKAEWARRMVQENALTASDLIWPLFLVDGSKARVPVPAMPGVERVSVDEAVRDAERAVKLGIPCIALFPYTDPGLRDEDRRLDLVEPLGKEMRTHGRDDPRARPHALPERAVGLEPYPIWGHSEKANSDERRVGRLSLFAFRSSLQDVLTW